ncbi:MAG: hypothetical protein LBT60_04955 [Oscillospiraceae bacterium]|jgi:hypothetical protein|nr:hypothetical protein [Oscillospiraceae bacterium]
MTISFQGFHENVATFAGAAAPGHPVKLTGPGAVTPAAADNVFCGVSAGGGGGHVSVQLTGYVALPYTGTPPTPGYVKLVANGAGGVKTAASGREYLVLDTDAVRQTTGFLLA